MGKNTPFYVVDERKEVRFIMISFRFIAANFMLKMVVFKAQGVVTLRLIKDPYSKFLNTREGRGRSIYLWAVDAGY